MYHFLVHMHWYLGTRDKRRRAGAGNGTCTGTYANQYRPLTSAPAQQFWCTYMYHFVVHMYRYGGTRRKCRRAGTSNGTCVGTHSNQHRPLVSTPAQQFEVYKCTGYHFVVHMYRYGGEEQVPARRRQQRDMPWHLFRSISTAN